MGGVPLGTTLQPNTTPCASLNGFGPLHTPGLSRNVPSIQHGTGGEGREVVGWGGVDCLSAAPPCHRWLWENADRLHSTPLHYLSDKLPLPVGEACVPSQNGMFPGTETRQCHNGRSDYISTIRFTVLETEKQLAASVFLDAEYEREGVGLRRGTPGRSNW